MKKKLVTVSQQESGKLYIDCYAAFGGINGSIGAKSRFTLPIEEGTTVIGIYRDKDCYEEVLGIILAVVLAIDVLSVFFIDKSI